MKRETKDTLMFSAFVQVACFLVVGCSNGKPGENGTNGSNGSNGVGCEVVQLANGSEIKCGGNTTAVVLNGTDASLPPASAVVTEIIDPCGKQGSFDEIILRLSNGMLIGHFSHGNLQFLTPLPSGNYATTDGTNCNFVVNPNGTVGW